jgi:hypothetical protein
MLTAMPATAPTPPPLSITSVRIVTPRDDRAVPKYGKVELLVTLDNVAATRLYDPDPDASGLDLSATFTGPAGTETVHGYDDGASFRVRFTPRHEGSWTFSVKAVDSSGTAAWSRGSFSCVPSDNPGFSHIDGQFPSNPREP